MSKPGVVHFGKVVVGRCDDFIHLPNNDFHLSRMRGDAIIAQGELSAKFGGRELYFAPFIEDLRLVRINATHNILWRNVHLFQRSLQLCGNLEVVILRVMNLRSLLRADFAANLLSSNPGIWYVKLSSDLPPRSPEEACALWITLFKTIQSQNHRVRRLHLMVLPSMRVRDVLERLTAACLEKQNSNSMRTFLGMSYPTSLNNERNLVEDGEAKWHKAILAKRKLYICITD